MNKETGRPAFPSNVWWETGMTLRDYFAAKAMQGIIAGCGTLALDTTAETSYAYADAMLKAREQ